MPVVFFIISVGILIVLADIADSLRHIKNNVEEIKNKVKYDTK